MDPDALKLLQTEFIEDCLNFSSATLMVYEYLTTIDHEVELVWRRNAKLSLPSILLVSTRVCMVATAIISVTPSSTTCTGFTALDILMQIAELTSFIQVALFSALRVSALYGSNIALFVSVFALGLVPVGTNIYNQTRTTYVSEMGTCIAITTVSEGLIRKFVLATRIPVIMADFLVLTLTWAKTYRQILLSRSAGISAPLSACLARDGALYFLVLLTLNILQIASNRTQIGAPVSIIVSALPSILINRFMINLRHVGSDPDSSGSVTPDRLVISTPRFQLSDQVVGSMGEPLEHGAPVVFDEEEDEAYEENIEVDEYNPEREEREGGQERSTEISGSGVVLF